MKYTISKEKLEEDIRRLKDPDLNHNFDDQSKVAIAEYLLSCLESEEEHKDICSYCEGNKDVGNCSHSKVKPISGEECEHKKHVIC